MLSCTTRHSTIVPMSCVLVLSFLLSLFQLSFLFSCFSLPFAPFCEKQKPKTAGANCPSFHFLSLIAPRLLLNSLLLLLFNSLHFSFHLFLLSLPTQPQPQPRPQPQLNRSLRIYINYHPHAHDHTNTNGLSELHGTAETSSAHSKASLNGKAHLSPSQHPGIHLTALGHLQQRSPLLFLYH